MIFSSRQLATTLFALQKEGVPLDKLAKNTFGFLKRKKKISLLSSLLAELKQMEMAEKNVGTVKIFSAHSLSDVMKKMAEKKAKEFFLGKTLECSFHEDASLLGGIVFVSDEKKWDGSVKTRISALQKSL